VGPESPGGPIAETDRGTVEPLPLPSLVTVPVLAVVGVIAVAAGTGRRRSRPESRGFSLVELLISIAIIGLLASLLLPALGRARQKARSIECVSNLKQIYLANTMFAAEHDGHYVPAAEDIDKTGGGLTRWHGTRKTINGPFDPRTGPLAEYLPDSRVKECPVFFEFRRQGEAPNAFESGTGGYGYNMHYIGATSYADDFPDDLRSGTRDSRVRSPARTIMFADAALPQNGYLIEYGFVEPPFFPSPEFPQGNPAFGNSSPSIHFRHNGRANVLWADGHVTSEPFGWTTETNIYGARNAAWAVGWFGPKTNYFFDSGDKAAFQSPPPDTD
jgi:prepilin-type processing-associated H-X9-DG protein/prepilin-type N-terminal cleavage/methylation domain-containing protein